MNGYSVGDIARTFGISKSTAHAIATGSSYRDVLPSSSAPALTRSRPAPYVDSVLTLRSRGHSVASIAQQLGISAATVYRALGAQQ